MTPPRCPCSIPGSPGNEGHPPPNPRGSSCQQRFLLERTKTGYSRRKIREFQLLLPKAKKKSTRNRWETQTFPWGNDPNPQGILLGKPVTPQGRENRPSWSWFVQQQLEKAQEKEKKNFKPAWKCKKLEGGKTRNVWDLHPAPAQGGAVRAAAPSGLINSTPCTGRAGNQRDIPLGSSPRRENSQNSPPPGPGMLLQSRAPSKNQQTRNKPTPKQGMEEDSRKKRRAGGAEFRAATPTFRGAIPDFPVRCRFGRSWQVKGRRAAR